MLIYKTLFIVFLVLQQCVGDESDTDTDTDIDSTASENTTSSETDSKSSVKNVNNITAGTTRTSVNALNHTVTIATTNSTNGALLHNTAFTANVLSEEKTTVSAIGNLDSVGSNNTATGDVANDVETTTSTSTSNADKDTTRTTTTTQATDTVVTDASAESETTTRGSYQPSADVSTTKGGMNITKYIGNIKNTFASSTTQMIVYVVVFSVCLVLVVSVTAKYCYSRFSRVNYKKHTDGNTSPDFMYTALSDEDDEGTLTVFQKDVNRYGSHS